MQNRDLKRAAISPLSNINLKLQLGIKFKAIVISNYFLVQRMQRITTTSSKSGTTTASSAPHHSSQQQAPPQNLIEKTIHFSQPQAIVWQIKFIINQISSKKALNQASNEIENLSAKFGKDFDKYLLKELIEQIDLKDPAKAQKDKNEPFKVQLLTLEVARCSQKPDYLQYFGEIAQTGGFSDRLGDFMAELTKRLKLAPVAQILVALSLVDSCREDLQGEATKILKHKLLDYYHGGRPEPIPEYALHKLLFLLSTHPDMNGDENRDNIQYYLMDSNQLKTGQHISLRGALQQDLMYSNASVDEPSICLFKEGNGIDNLDKSYRMLEPWQLLVDLGHYSSYNYNYLLKILEDFKDINEKGMARTLLNLAINHTGCDDQASKIAQNTFEANKKGDSTLLRKEIVDKKNQITWSVDNLVRAFRELFSHLNWQKVFEALSEITEELSLDQKAFATFLQITSKSKPQNLPYPLGVILQTQWASPLLQLSFIENSISFYVDKKEKSIYFNKAGDRRQETIEEITGVKEKVSAEYLHVWLSVDLVERLLNLSNSQNFARVRQAFESPLKQIPEYLLLTLSLCKPPRNSLLLDELLSLLLPQFLANHINSIFVLQALWRNNQSLMIRAICELCRHDQRIMNLSRVLDITQEVKESLMPIVDCEDYYFAVNLAILAGKRDFLHYDVWLQRRITDVGTPFIKAMLKYIKEHIIQPISDYLRRTQSQETQEQLEAQKVQVLEKSHLSKEKLAMTIENLQNLQIQHNPLIKEETKLHIRDVVTKLGEYFPGQFSQNQNSEVIDNAANDYFQKVFSAEPNQVDNKITELIETMQKFRTSEVKMEQEIYACMLHSLFDEYRFLHKYPNQYLEKIAKLFGAIIKNRIMDSALQEIALKFVLEAYRRDGKRMKFGVIVIRHILEMLPQFPQFFDSIYEHRNQIHQTDPQLLKEIEELYERTMGRTARTRAPSGALEEQSSRQDDSVSSKYRSTVSSISNESFEEAKAEPLLAKVLPKLGKAVSTDVTQAQQMPSFIEAEFLNTFNKNCKEAVTPIQPPPPVIQGKKGGPQPQKNAEAGTKKGGIPPSSAQAPDFKPTPTYVKKNTVEANTGEAHGQQVFHPQPSEAAAQSAKIAETAFTALGTTSSQGLNPSSQAFRRPAQPVPAPNPPSATGFVTLPAHQMPFIPAQQPGPNFINSVRTFKPTVMKASGPMPQPQPQPLPFNQVHYQMQLLVEQKLQKAIQESVRVKIEDVVEDSTMPGPNPEHCEELKVTLNMTGKNNVNKNVEKIKAIISDNVQVNMNWFIHFILTKRLSSQNLFSIYIDMIKHMGQKDAISVTITQAVDIFKKCILVDEDQLNLVAQRTQSNASLVKQYLVNLGTFIGQLTVAGNRPIYAKELDIKQVLVESFTSNKMKLVVTFVCRILKECSKSIIFKYQNPWVKANLEIIKEIYESCGPNSNVNPNNDILMEIDSLFKTFGLNVQDVQHQGFLKALVSQQYTNPSQQVELRHLSTKSKIVPSIQNPQSQNQQLQPEYPRVPSVSPSPGHPFQGGPFPPLQQPSRYPTPGQQNSFEQQQQIRPHQYTDIQKVFQKAVISNELLQLLGIAPGKLQQQHDQLLRRIIAESVDQSINEILPPVVDRSVTIALITTRELVLKDFAFDPNAEKILKAADLIVQNLAGSLALVTCREPLKMQLSTNLKKSLQSQMSMSLFSADGDLQMPPMNEALINDLGQQASKDNLELGCKLIKKAVIEKALTKVREDISIMRAIEARQAARSPQEFKNNALMDEAMLSQFAELPQQLKPSPDGLTDPQFQVYQDFARLSTQSMSTGPSSTQDTNRIVSETSLSDPNEDIEAYLKQYESLQIFDKKFEHHLSQKITFMNSRPDQGEQIKKLVKFCEIIFKAVCERMVAPQQQQNQDRTVKILDFLTFVTANLRLVGNEDLQSKLTQNFLALDGTFVNNAVITLEFMRRGILSHSKWDSQIAIFIKENQQFSSSLSNPVSELFTFLREFFEMAVQDGGARDLTYQHFPAIMALIQKLAEQDANLAQFFATLIQDFRQMTIWTKDALRAYFNEWAVISFEEAGNPAKQEAELNRFFNTLKNQGLYKDNKAMLKFCKNMLELSVEKAIYLSDGVTKRSADRLVYRYIESFLNFLVVSLMNFTSSGDGMNKHEFLAQVFDAIFQVLDEDHRNKKGEFNQKPYYRILIIILRVVSNSQTFNLRTQQQVMINLADLFIKLSPKEYPAFSFAWLELISHRLFLPYFLQVPQGQLQGNQSQQQLPGGLAQSRKPGQQGPQPQLGQLPDTNSSQKWFKFKDITLCLFTFLKNNMIVGQPMSEPLAKLYEATLRIVLVIKNDFPEFLCDFHFNFVNNLPDHCIQLRNVILSAQPRSIPVIDPFSRNLKVDTLPEIGLPPRSQSNYENYLHVMNLREDLERYFREKSRGVIQVIADKMMQSEEYINGRKRINSSIFNAVALFIQNYAQSNRSRLQQAQKECYEMLKQIILILSSETRLCLLNSIVNELRYINSHTYFYSWMVIYMFNDVDESVQEQISRILIERLQTHGPHPWGLCITFRELLQNPKYNFAKKSFVVRNQAEIELLMQTKLENFQSFWVNNRQLSQQQNPQQIGSSQGPQQLNAQQQYQNHHQDHQ